MAVTVAPVSLLVMRMALNFVLGFIQLSYLHSSQEERWDKFRANRLDRKRCKEDGYRLLPCIFPLLSKEKIKEKSWDWNGNLSDDELLSVKSSYILIKYQGQFWHPSSETFEEKDSSAVEINIYALAVSPRTK